MTDQPHVVYCSVFRYGPFAVAKIGCSRNFPSRAKYVKKTASRMFGDVAQICHYVIVNGSYDMESQISTELAGFTLFPLGPPRTRHVRYRAGWCEWFFWNDDVAQYVQSFAPIHLSDGDLKCKMSEVLG